MPVRGFAALTVCSVDDRIPSTPAEDREYLLPGDDGGISRCVPQMRCSSVSAWVTLSSWQTQGHAQETIISSWGHNCIWNCRLQWRQQKPDSMSGMERWGTTWAVKVRASGSG
jgi:hypothetical protein